MGVKQPMILPVSAPLDTANPSTNRAPGTLLEAVDVAHRWLGPRRCGEMQTWPGRLPSGYSTYPGAFPTNGFDGTNSRIVGVTEREQADLGTRWTADLCFHATEARTSSAAVPVFQWRIDNSITAIEMGFYGSTHATNPNKLYAIVKTTSSAGSVGHTFTLVSVAPLLNTALVSSGAIVRVFMRLIRDGTTLTLKTSRGADVTDATLLNAEPHIGTTSQKGSWLFAHDAGLGANTTFKGEVVKAMIRSSAVSANAPLRAIEHIFPRAPDVIFSATTKGVSSRHVEDNSRHGAHGVWATAASALGNDRYYPVAKTVQGFGPMTDVFGVGHSMVMAGGVGFVTRDR